jgi:aspartyl-tRNA(Asn)/glutamyl-tRNA(Gln) amidotransferase subunit C
VALTKTDVAKLADLARIELTDEEAAAMAGQLDLILQAVAAVSEVATPDVAPTSHALDLTNAFRADQVQASLPRDLALAMAPAVEDAWFKVPRILEQS